MRSLLCVCLVACVVLTAGFAGAATPGQVSDNTLAMMGLSGMQSMSDVQGMEVRGTSFVATAGFSYAVSPGSAAASGYVAAGSHYASGNSGSIAASGIGGSLGFVVVGAAAGTTSTAIAH